jgi:coproporphyrinogen III oxidase
LAVNNSFPDAFYQNEIKLAIIYAIIAIKSRSKCMRIPAQSQEAKEVDLLLSGLQVYFVSKLNAMALQFGEGKSFKSVSWECDKGKHGGGKRYEARDRLLFNQAAVTVSGVHYTEVKNKALDLASVFSVTLHPNNPHLPSMHFSVSWEKMKEAKGCWHIMADLNPSILSESVLDENIFVETLKNAMGNLYEEGVLKGDTYFNIPALGRHRGGSHFYLEGYDSGNFEQDKALVLEAGESIIQSYMELVSIKLKEYPAFTQENKEEQLAYHTLYLFQVLMFDQDTAKSLLLHDQDDVGILASLPSHINRNILSLWLEKVSAPQDLLLKQILKVLPNVVPTPVDERSKRALATVIRKYYKKYPRE